MGKKKTGFGLRMAFGGEMPSALERRLNDRLNAGTLTVRGAGMLSDIENQRRGDATQRYGVDTQAATARYGVDAQSAIARMNDATQRFGIGTQADTARYGVDAQSATARMNDATQRYGVDTQADTSRYGYDTSAATARMNDATQRYGVDTQADTARYGVDAQSATAKMNNTTNLLGMNLQADTQRYGMDSNLLSNMWRMKNGGEIQPVRLGLRNGGEIHAANGYMHGGFAEQGMGVKFLSPYDKIKTQAELADIDLKQEYMRAQTEALRSGIPRAPDTQVENNMARIAESKARFGLRRDERQFDRQIAAQDEDRKMLREAFDTKQRNDFQDRAIALRDRDIALRDAQKQKSRDNARYVDGINAAQRAATAANNREQNALGAAWMTGQQAAPQVDPQVDPYEAQDRARLNERRNMYDTALRGHFNAGGFGAMRPPVNAAARNFGMPRGYNLRDGGEIHAAKGGIWGAIKGAVGMGDSDEEFAAKMNKGEPELKQTDLAAAHAARLKREGGTWGGSGGETARTVPTSTGKSFDGVSVQTKRSLREHGLLANGGTLQTGKGGDVPGTGKGDKIPAKYEPGEFVVSNDMLAAEPELRDHLRALREQVLAAKGMTVQEADAKAMGGGKGLRAAAGGDLTPEELEAYRRSLVGSDEAVREIEDGLAAKRARGDNIRNALSKNDGFAKIAALNQQAAEADARTMADASRGVFRDVDPTMSPELAASRDEGRRRDLRSYADAQSAALDAGKSAPALPKSLSDTGNIYKTVDDQGRVTYSGGNVKSGAKFIGGNGEEFTPRGSVEYAKPGEPVGMFPGGGGVMFTPASGDSNQRAKDIATATAKAAEFRAQRAAQDEADSRAYHEAGMAGNREIEKNQSLRDIDARVKEATSMLNSKSYDANHPRMQAALKTISDSGALIQGIEKSYADGETARARDASLLRAEGLRAQADTARTQAPIKAAEAQRQTIAAIRQAYPDPVAAAQAADRMGLTTVAKQFRDEIKDAQGVVGTQRDLQEKAVGNIANTVLGQLSPSGDAKQDEATAKRIASAIGTTYPDSLGMSPKELSEKAPRWAAEITVADKLRDIRGAGFESWMPDVATKPTAENQQRIPAASFFKGATLKPKISGIDAWAPGQTDGDYVLHMPDNKNINLGKLTADEIDVFKDMISGEFYKKRK